MNARLIMYDSIQTTGPPAKMAENSCQVISHGMWNQILRSEKNRSNRRRDISGLVKSNVANIFLRAAWPESMESLRWNNANV